MRFDLADLNLFRHVVEAGSITAGSERANLALAAASTRVRNMEEALGAALLVRGRQGVTPARPRTSSAAPSASSMRRMRVLAAASARCARSAPCVMLPASTTWRNRLKSARSKRTERLLRGHLIRI